MWLQFSDGCVTYNSRKTGYVNLPHFRADNCLRIHNTLNLEKASFYYRPFHEFSKCNKNFDSIPGNNEVGIPYSVVNTVKLYHYFVPLFHTYAHTFTSILNDFLRFFCIRLMIAEWSHNDFSTCLRPISLY